MGSAAKLMGYFELVKKCFDGLIQQLYLVLTTFPCSAESCLSNATDSSISCTDSIW